MAAPKLVYTTKDGDVLDAILFTHYGQGVSVLQKVLLANPGLAGYGPVYRAGVKIILPDIPKAAIVTTIRPWS
jgi:phage tail protein X